MSFPVPKSIPRLAPATAIGIAALAMAIAITLLTAWPAAEAQSYRPRTDGRINITNPAQPQGAYYREGDSIWFEIRVDKALQPLQVDPGISEANHFHFAYHTNGTAQKAKLAAVATDSGGQYLLYRHVVPAGAYNNEAGNLYYRTNPRPAVSNHLWSAASDSGKLEFRGPAANNLPLNGTARVAALSANSGKIPTRHPVATPSDIHLVQPPAAGYYIPGDDLTFRVVYSKRLTPVTVPEGQNHENRIRLLLNDNTDNTDIDDDLRKARLIRAANVGDHGYAEYRYTVQPGDQDTDGVRFWSQANGATSRLCPEYIGASCSNNNDARITFPSGSGHVIPGARIAPALAWADDAKTSIDIAHNFNLNINNTYGVLGSIAGTIADQPLFLSANPGLPGTLELYQRGNSILLAGSPNVTSSASRYTIAAEDATGRKAELPVTISISPGAVSLPNNTDGRYNVSVHAQQRSYEQIQLPTATANAPASYSLTQRDGSALPVCIRYEASPFQPGRVSFNSGNSNCAQASTQTFNLRYSATITGALTANLDFTFGITAGTAKPDLDEDDNGLIEIHTAEQLMAVRYDRNGDGRPDPESPNSGSIEYFASTALAPYGGFPAASAATGCPSTGCIGYELVNDIDLNQLEAWWKKPANFVNLTTVNHFNSETGKYDRQGHLWNAVFDGKGHTITGINFQQAETWRIGLFGQIGANGVIRNLGLIRPSVSGDQAVGAIAGVNQGTIENVYVLEGKVNAVTASAGLIAGENRGTIRNFWATGSVDTASAGTGSAVGGHYGSAALMQNGWTDAFTDQNTPLAANQGFSYVAGYTDNLSRITQVREIDSRASQADDRLWAYLTTDANLKAGTAAAGFTSSWANGIWDFGDKCQRPALNSGGHNAAEQREARGPAC